METAVIDSPRPLVVNDSGTEPLYVWEAQSLWIPQAGRHVVLSPNASTCCSAPSRSGVLPGETEVFRYPNGRYGNQEWTRRPMYYDPGHPQIPCTPTAAGINHPGKEILWEDLDESKVQRLGSDAAGPLFVLHQRAGNAMRGLLDPVEDFVKSWEQRGELRAMTRVRCAWQIARHSVLHLVHGLGLRFAELRRQWACVTRNVLNAWAWMYYVRWIEQGRADYPPPAPWHFVGVFFLPPVDAVREMELARKYYFAGVPVYRIVPRLALNPEIRIRVIAQPAPLPDYGLPECSLGVIHDGFFVSVLLSHDPSQFTFRQSAPGQPLQFVGSINALGQVTRPTEFAEAVGRVMVSGSGAGPSSLRPPDQPNQSGGPTRSRKVSKSARQDAHSLPRRGPGPAGAKKSPQLEAEKQRKQLEAEKPNLERRMRHLVGQTAPWSVAVIDINFAWRAALTPANTPVPAKITRFSTFAPDPVLMMWLLRGPEPAGGQEGEGLSAKGLPRAHGWLHLRDVLRPRFAAIVPSADGPDNVTMYRTKVWDDIINQRSFHRLFHCPPTENNNSLFAQSLVPAERLASLPTPSTALLIRGQHLEPGAALPVDVIQEVIWELSEISFRVELLQLDAMLAKSHSPQATQRRERVLACYPDHELVPALTVRPDEGIGARDIGGMTASAQALARIMNDWRFDGLPVLDAEGRELLAEEPTAQASTSAVIALLSAYVRAFSVSFGRPPTVPRVRPAVLRPGEAAEN